MISVILWGDFRGDHPLPLSSPEKAIQQLNVGEEGLVLWLWFSSNTISSFTNSAQLRLVCLTTALSKSTHSWVENSVLLFHSRDMVGKEILTCPPSTVLVWFMEQFWCVQEKVQREETLRKLCSVLPRINFPGLCHPTLWKKFIDVNCNCLQFMVNQHGGNHMGSAVEVESVSDFIQQKCLGNPKEQKAFLPKPRVMPWDSSGQFPLGSFVYVDIHNSICAWGCITTL